MFSTTFATPTNPLRPSSLRRAGLLVSALALAAAGALGGARPVAAESTIWTGYGGAHDQDVSCSMSSLQVAIYPSAQSMDSFPSGQWVASQIIYRDVTANGAWVYRPWSLTFVNGWRVVHNPEWGDQLVKAPVLLPGYVFTGVRGHVYSVFVAFQYANAQGVYQWKDMHPTNPYTMITTAGQQVSTTKCQTGF